MRVPQKLDPFRDVVRVEHGVAADQLGGGTAPWGIEGIYRQASEKTTLSYLNNQSATKRMSDIQSCSHSISFKLSAEMRERVFDESPISPSLLAPHGRP
jgi:hypothetical protein